jgi:hypothetical protein
VTGRRSTAVKGVFTAMEALRALLAGTGLDAHRVGERAITLLPGPAQERPRSLAYRRYSAALQNAALRQLCHDRQTRLGTYRLAMQLWLDELGHVRRIELLSSTGDLARDERIHELVRSISVGGPPPMLPQPITMVILPRSPQESGDCPADDVPLPDVGERDGQR